MEPQIPMSRYIIWILIALGIIAIVIALVMRGDNNDSGGGDTDRELARCGEDLLELNTRLAAAATRTPQLEAEFQALIERCSNVVEEARASQ